MRLLELLKLLRDDQLVWSEDFESIRKPLLSLLTHIEQVDTHQFDDDVDAIAKALLDD
jgi:hypothetical protein